MKNSKFLKDKYKIEKILGQGGTSRVYLCKNIRLGNYCAVKHLYSHSATLSTEVEILKKLNHPGLPNIIDVIEEDGQIYIIESYIEGTSLSEFINDNKHPDEDTALEWIKDLCNSLSYLHNMKPFPIIHRDIKPHNIIISHGNRAVLIDFGISKENTPEELSDKISAGTKIYAAPEQFSAGGLSDQRTDIYSLGITFYHLLTKRLPAFNPEKIYTFNKKISPELDIIIGKCINENPEKRYQRIEDLYADVSAVRLIHHHNEKISIKNKFILVLSFIFSAISIIFSYLGFKNLLDK